MNNALKTFFIIQIFCTVCLAVNNQAYSPIGNPTVPPSSVRSGLTRSPNPINTNGNLVVTGNVSGGTQFRGLVPYRSTTDFGSSAGSSDISSFLRRSAPIDISSGQTSPQPYYLPSSTVSSLNRYGASGLTTYPSIRETGGTGDFIIPKYVNAQAASGTPMITLPSGYTLARPMSYNNQTDLERLVGTGLVSRREKGDLTAVLHKTNENDKDNLKTNQMVQLKDGNIPSKLEPLKPDERSEPAKPQQSGQVQPDSSKVSTAKSVYEQMLEEIGTGGTEISSANEQMQITKQSQTDTTTVKESNAMDMRSNLSEIDKKTAEALVGVHKTFAVMADDKFNSYMKSAEEFLKQGQYYRAADAYTLASIYNPGDPLAYAGRSHALFASGEYMSSAYYLMTAINIFPQYVKFKIDLNAMIPDKDRLESRITDITKWIEKNNSPELNLIPTNNMVSVILAEAFNPQ